MVSSWELVFQFHAEPVLPPHDAPGCRAHREVRHRSGQSRSGFQFRFRIRFDPEVSGWSDPEMILKLEDSKPE